MTKQLTYQEPAFDLRLIERNLRLGKLDRKEYEASLKKLPDDSKNAVEMEVYEEPRPEEPTPHVSDDLTFT